MAFVHFVVIMHNRGGGHYVGFVYCIHKTGAELLQCVEESDILTMYTCTREACADNVIRRKNK